MKTLEMKRCANLVRRWFSNHPWPIWLKPFFVRTCMVFSRSRAFLVCFGQVFVTQFCSFPLVLMARVDDGTDVLISLMPGTSSNSGSPDVSGTDLDEMGHRSIDAQFKEFRNISLPLGRGFADFDNHVKTLSETVGMVISRIASVEQTVNALSAKMASFAALEQKVSTLTEDVSSLTARICKFETNATGVSSGSNSARSWNILGPRVIL